MQSRTLDFHSGKTVDLSILRARMQESPRTASTGETPLGKKGGRKIFFSRHETAFSADDSNCCLGL